MRRRFGIDRCGRESILRTLVGLLLSALGVMLLAVVLGLLLSCLAGCSRRQYMPPVESVSTEYVRADSSSMYERVAALLQSRLERESRSDSVVDREKLTVVLNTAGDTVRVTERRYVYASSSRELELESVIERMDSVIRRLRMEMTMVRCDSVAVPYPVERELTVWEQTRMDFGGIAIGGLVIGICVAVIWLIVKFKR